MEPVAYRLHPLTPLAMTPPSINLLLMKNATGNRQFFDQDDRCALACSYDCSDAAGRTSTDDQNIRFQNRKLYSRCICRAGLFLRRNGSEKIVNTGEIRE